MAQRYEKNSTNNNVFNGKNISDHTAATQYYQTKFDPSQAQTLHRITQEPQRQQDALFRDVTNGMGGLFSNDMLNQFFDDNATIKVSKNPSNLVEVPRVNEKYENKSFFGGPGSRPTQLPEGGGLRTLGLFGNSSSANPLDSILNLNPTFYGSSKPES